MHPIYVRLNVLTLILCRSIIQVSSFAVNWLHRHVLDRRDVLRVPKLPIHVLLIFFAWLMLSNKILIHQGVLVTSVVEGAEGPPAHQGMPRLHACEPNRSLAINERVLCFAED